MEIIATQKFVKTSPRKLRLVADMVRNLDPTRAVDVLPHVGKRAAEPLAKVIKTAIANAKVKGFSEEDLKIKEVQINEGPRLKRGRPVSKGRWHPYKKRMSHVRVVLTAQKSKTPGTKSQVNSDKQMPKPAIKGKKDVLKRVLRRKVDRKSDKSKVVKATKKGRKQK